MNAKVVGNTIQDVAASVSGSTWWKRITGDGHLADEIAETIASSSKLGHDREKFFSNLSQDLHTKLNMDVDKADAIAKRIKPGNANAVEKAIASENLDERSAEIMRKAAKDAAEKSKISAGDMNLLQAAAEYPRAYFGIADEATRKTRVRTAIAGYAGVAVGGRVLSGGSLTKDEYGRSDIAGIPFI